MGTHFSKNSRVSKLKISPISETPQAKHIFANMDEKKTEKNNIVSQEKPNQKKVNKNEKEEKFLESPHSNLASKSTLKKTSHVLLTNNFILKRFLNKIKGKSRSIAQDIPKVNFKKSLSEIQNEEKKMCLHLNEKSLKKKHSKVNIFCKFFISFSIIFFKIFIRKERKFQTFKQLLKIAKTL